MAKAQKKVAAGDTQPTSRESKDVGKKISKTEQVIKLLKRKNGASLDDLQKATGWQPHSVRGFLAGLRKRGLMIERITIDGQKGAYHIAGA